MTNQRADARRYGGFDVIRIVAALSVVLYHSYAITGRDQDLPALWIGHYRMPLGSIGVAVFFVISGFLVVTSWDRAPRWSVFAWHRFARIWPALTMTVVLTVMVLGPIMTTLPLHNYFASRRSALHLVRGVTLFGGSINALPGVFLRNPRHAVNGSLWTLTYEVWAYVALLVFAVCGGLRRRGLVVALFGAVLVFFRLAVYDGVGGLPIDRTVLTMSIAKGAELGAYFLAGTAISRFVGSFEPRRLAPIGVAALALGSLLREPAIFIPGVAMTVIGVGASQGKVTDFVHRFGDPSYGIYILSFPIQQLVYSSGLARTPAVMFMVSGALSVAAGYLSWHFLERPMLRWARRRDARRLEFSVAG